MHLADPATTNFSIPIPLHRDTFCAFNFARLPYNPGTCPVSFFLTHAHILALNSKRNTLSEPNTNFFATPSITMTEVDEAYEAADAAPPLQESDGLVAVMAVATIDSNILASSPTLAIEPGKFAPC